MKTCCDKYVHESEPKHPQNTEYFYEIQYCKTCGQKLRIKFQRIETFEAVEYVPLSAEVL